MKLFVIALLFCVAVFIVGGIGLSFSEVSVEQKDVSQTMTMSDIQALAVTE